MSRTLVSALIFLVSSPIFALSLKGPGDKADFVRTERYPRVSIQNSGLCGSDGVKKRLANESEKAATVVVCLEIHRPPRDAREFSYIEIGGNTTVELGCTAGESGARKHFGIHWAGFSGTTPPNDVKEAKQSIFVFTLPTGNAHLIQNKHFVKDALVEYEYKEIRHVQRIDATLYVSPLGRDKIPPRIISATFDKPYMGSHCITGG